MRLKKPIKQFTLEELIEAQEHLQNLVNATRTVTDNLGDSTDPLHELLDAHMRLAIFPEKTTMTFKELAEHNFQTFKMMYELVVEELGKRETYVD